MRANIIYILMAAGLFVSCENYMETDGTYLGGSSKTPIAVRTNIQAAPTTRAYDKTFEENDQLFACIEAGKQEGKTFTPVSQFTWADNFTMGETVDNGGTPAGTGLITNSDKLSPVLYWDDFSSTEYDLREEGRGIRLKYGYCYNGGTPSTALDTEAGTLTWTVLSDQSASDGSAMKHSDLLYASTQPMKKYGHDAASRETLELPYTHAMSKITINVKTGEGFSNTEENFKNSVLTLMYMETVAEVDAPAGKVTPKGEKDDITTFIKSNANTSATYQAIVAPTHLSAGNVLASITDIDGNNYDIPLTENILTAWSAESHLVASYDIVYNGVAQAKPRKAEAIPGGTGYLTKPGIHYILDVVVDKQKITIRATITDWQNVQASGKAEIKFAPDVQATGSIDEALKAGGFDVYKSSTNDAFSTKSTTVTNVSNVWQYSPTIYWAGQSDNSYFRALSPKGSSTSVLAQGGDILWGTSGNDAITPRTGDVPLTFEHLMSKLSINLKTVSGDAAVDLTDAKIAISNMATTATYSIVNGTVSASDVVGTMLSGKLSGFVETVIPQTIGNDAKVTITLKDGTTYSVQLNQCKTNAGSAVSAWTKGKSYTYTITLSKQEITFSAEVKDWVEQSASGNATLDWD